MLGTKERDFKVHPKISLDALVPQDNFYRHVESCVDLSFVRELAAEFYADIGRPSIDPVVFFKLQLVAFFEGVRSERQLMEMVNLNLAHRWFIGYDLDEMVPRPQQPQQDQRAVWVCCLPRLFRKDCRIMQGGRVGLGRGTLSGQHQSASQCKHQRDD